MGGGRGAFESRGNNKKLNPVRLQEEERDRDHVGGQQMPRDIPVSPCWGRGSGHHRLQKHSHPWNQRGQGMAGLLRDHSSAKQELGGAGDTDQQNCPTGLECRIYTQKGLIYESRGRG